MFRFTYLKISVSFREVSIPSVVSFFQISSRIAVLIVVYLSLNNDFAPFVDGFILDCSNCLTKINHQIGKVSLIHKIVFQNRLSTDIPLRCLITAIVQIFFFDLWKVPQSTLVASALALREIEAMFFFHQSIAQSGEQILLV